MWGLSYSTAVTLVHLVHDVVSHSLCVVCYGCFIVQAEREIFRQVLSHSGVPPSHPDV